MERRSFLKRLGVFAGASLIPNWLIPAEKKGIGQNPYNFPLTDHKPYKPYKLIGIGDPTPPEDNVTIQQLREMQKIIEVQINKELHRAWRDEEFQNRNFLPRK